MECGIEAGPGQEQHCGSGLEKQVRPYQHQESGSGPGQTPPRVPGSWTKEADSSRGAFSENSCATPPLVDDVGDRDNSLPCASRRGAAECPGGAAVRSGGGAEEHSHALVKCTSEGAATTVGQKALVGFVDEPEVEGIVDEVRSRN
ncbi:hypothetical protein HN51_065533 [Arachis hypogaea]